LVKDLVVGSDPQRINTSVCVLNRHGWCGEVLKKAGYKIWDLEWKIRDKGIYHLSREIRHIIKKERISIVHAHNFVPLFMTFPAVIFTGAELLVTFHGFLTWRLYSRLSYPFLYFYADKIVIVSEAMRRHYSLPANCLHSKVINIANGIDLKRFEATENYLNRNEIGLSEQDFVIGSVGRLSPVKNQIMQIKVCHILKNEIPNLKLVLITGQSPDSGGLIDEFRSLSRELEIEDRVIFLGYRRDVPQILKTVNVFLMTSLTEGTSLALLEAMASGLPVVASNVGGNAQLIAHGKNGILFDANDLNGLAGHILDLYSQPSKRQRLGSEAKATAQQYSLETMVKNYEELYAHIFDS